MSKLRKDIEKNLKSIDCTDFLYSELKKELIGPSDGLFNRQKYKKIKEKKGE